MFNMLAGILLFGTLAVARSLDHYDASPYSHLQPRRATVDINSDAPTADLGYGVYQGSVNNTANMNIFLGIPFAQPPTGNLRWQAPQPPKQDRSKTKSATEYGPYCWQALASSGEIKPDQFNGGASEDCLFVNVYSPNNVTGLLPTMVWIHGGGYGAGNGRQDLTPIINTNGNAFVGVTIQYRLGAFGFLSSDDVERHGSLNAGLLDQHLALHWVQKYIHLFGGDKSQVTITGESAGAGSVMLQDMAYGGTLGNTLFTKSLAASPYLPMQYGYADMLPSQFYQDFATTAGCTTTSGKHGSTFDCLVHQSIDVLSVANNNVSQTSAFGTYAFLPVTDGTFLQDLPSRQLNQGKVNGMSMLAGNNADEGDTFVPGNITTEDALVTWIHTTFPKLSTNHVDQILKIYPGDGEPDDPNAPLFATDGTSPPYALNQSSSATGNQQRAALIYGESTFMCPSYWLAEAYSSNKRRAYKYQFSVPPALHALETSAYFSYPSAGFYNPDLIYAFENIWGNYIVSGDPSISDVLANGLSKDNSTQNPISQWPLYMKNYHDEKDTYQINLNTTCASMEYIFLTPICVGDNRISLVNAYTWEDGRGERCEFWRSIGPDVPEKI